MFLPEILQIGQKSEANVVGKTWSTGGAMKWAGGEHPHHFHFICQKISCRSKDISVEAMRTGFRSYLLPTFSKEP